MSQEFDKEELTSKEKLCSSLTDRRITDKEYKHVLNVWKKLEMKTIKDYRNLYLKCDILLLADVFEKFRNNGLNIYGLCPSHYLNSPGLSWDATLKITKLNLNLFQILACIYSLRKVQEMECLIFLIYTVKSTINI